MQHEEMRRSTIESAVKAAATVYAHASAKYGEPLPKIRFVSDIPFTLQLNFTHRRRFGWQNHSLLDIFGIDMAADLDELHELMKDSDPWDVLMVSFPLQQKTASLEHAVLSYHRKREEGILDINQEDDRKPKHRAG